MSLDQRGNFAIASPIDRTGVSVHSLIETHAARRPEAIAIAAPGRVPLTYPQLARHLVSLAAQLKAVGLTSNDRVGVVLPNGPELAVALLAVSCAAVAVPLDPSLGRPELLSVFQRAGLKALLTLRGLESVAWSMARELRLVVIEVELTHDAPAGAFSMSSATGRIDEGGPRVNGGGMVLLTSGTTAQPKLVPVSQRRLCHAGANISRALSLSSDDRCLNFMPLFHGGGIAASLAASLTAGGSVVCTAGFDADKFFDWLGSFRPTWFTAVPAMHRAIVAEARRRGAALPCASLRFIRSGSAPLPEQLALDLEEVFGVPVIQGYALTEAFQITSTPLEDSRRRPRSVGVAVGLEVAIMHPSRNELLSSGEIGEVVCRGESVMPGYEDDDAANARAFADGWLRTGDEGFLDPEGHLYLTGRLKDVINHGGRKVSAAEVEHSLLECDGIQDVAVFSVPDALLGEVPGAAVVLRPGSHLDVAGIRQFAASRLAGYKVPKHVRVVPAIPKTATGKIRRWELADTLGMGHDDHFSNRPEYVAPRDTLEWQLAGIWETALQLTAIGIDDDFFDLGGNSLQAVRLFDAVEEQCAVTLPPSTLFSAPTIRALAQLMLRGEPVMSADLLLPIQTDGSRPPFIFLNGAVYGEGRFYCVRLSRLLGAGQPFFALASHGTDGSIVPPTIEQMAESQLQRLRRVRPTGPYLLGGYSHGALVALEMAHRLRTAGEEVPLLVVIDMAVPSPAQKSDRSRWTRAAISVRASVRYRLEKFYGPLRRPGTGNDAHRDSSDTAWRTAQWRRYRGAVARYRPKFYPGHVVLLVAKDGYALQRTGDPLLGWGGVARDVAVFSIPGTHQTCVTQHLEIIGEHLRAALG
jgi:acyl-CoA synthetase (AMP-forming)/AMP-acid ligase II/thioesterase domain-containing protein/acyl carrier protein